ncbi:MAG: diacylglycerol kinase family protein [Thermodesulfobacteriota bacterium]
MKEPNYIFIVNPTAGHGRSNSASELIREYLSDKEIKYDLQFTSKPGQAKRFARQAVDEGYTHIISVGGDGTSHEIVNGLMTAEGQIESDVIFGIIPSGSGNDFPKSASIPLDIKQAVETVFSGRQNQVDVGKLGDRYFINGLGIGLDGAVAHRFKNLKLLRGQFGYLLGSVQEAIGFKGFEVQIKIGDWEYQGSLLLTGASNGLYQGGKFKLAPDAKIDDRLLDFHVIKNMSIANRLIKIPKVLEGSHSGLDEVDIKTGTKMEIRLDQTVPAHTDGEPFYMEEGVHSVEILPGALNIMCA